MVQKGQVSSVKVDYSNQMNPESPYYGFNILINRCNEIFNL